jgi:hypothetical protein
MTTENPAEHSAQTVIDNFQTLVSLSSDRCRELRSVAVVFDWHGQLNQREEFVPAIWGDASGPIGPTDRAAIYGSMDQTLKLLHNQQRMMMISIGLLQEAVDAISAELQEKEKAKNVQEDPEEGKRFTALQHELNEARRTGKKATI